MAGSLAGISTFAVGVIFDRRRRSPQTRLHISSHPAAAAAAAAAAYLSAK